MSSIPNSPNLQIWDNAAFDDSVENPRLHPRPLQPIFVNLDDSLKENRSPNQNPNPKPLAQSKNPVAIDAEIADIERQISNLSRKLETLKIKKAQTESKTPASKRGRIVPAKFLNPETPRLASGSRRGLSLGPMDIYQNATPFKLKGIKEEKEKEKEKVKDLVVSRRRGMSIGPSEIRDIYKSATPFKLKGIKEEKENEKAKGLTVTRRRGMSIGEILRQKSKVQEANEKGVIWARSLSTSPKSRKPVNSKVLELRNGISTVGVKNPVKMDEGLITGIKPKTLFEEKKRPLKNAKVRIIESRYSLIEGGNKRRKWSLPDNEKDEKMSVTKSKKRSLSLGGANVRKLMEERSPLNSSIMRIAEALPKIRTLRGEIESPRDSGCAKRVADLVGKRSCFDEDDDLASPCQYLKFQDDEDQNNL